MYTLFSTKKVQHMQSNLSRNSPIKYLLRKRQDIFFCTGIVSVEISQALSNSSPSSQLALKLDQKYWRHSLMMQDIRNRVNGSNKISRTNHQFITLPGMKVVAVIVLVLTAALVLVALSFLPGGENSGSVSNSISNIYCKSNCSCGRQSK